MTAAPRLWIALLCLAAPLPALAQDDEDNADASRTQAGAFLKEGNALMDAKKYAEALQRFESAHHVFPSPKIFFSIAEAHDKLQAYARAAQYYQRFVDEADDAPEKLVARAKQRLAALEPYIGRISLSCEEDGVTVSIDGEEIGETPLRPQWAKAGPHKVSGKKAGFLPFETSVTVKVGEKKTVMLLVEPSEEAPAPTPEPVASPEPEPSPTPVAVVPPPSSLVSSAEPQIVDKPTDVAAQRQSGEGGVSGWLWVGLGAAAVAGAVVAIVLVTQTGNPFLPSGELPSSALSDWQHK
ncbi:MAG: PEGA domain-containing protein [Myxococcota bacterium]